MEDVIKTEEYFYAATLDKKGASVTWGAKDTEDFGASSERLHLRQILLGHSAKPDEYNVVEVETLSIHGTIKIPIAVLKVGESRTVQSNLEFPEGPVKFTLVEGSGPVYIHGQQVPSVYDDELAVEECMSEEDLAEEEEEEDEVEAENQKKKIKLSVDSEKNNKTQNLNNKKSK